MKLSWIGCAVVGTALISSVPAAAFAQSCVSTCNTAHSQCSEAGKNETVCLNAWHQCKVGCSQPKLQVSRPAPNTVVIKTSAPQPPKH